MGERVVCTFCLHMQLHSSVLCIAVKEKLALAGTKPRMKADFTYKYAPRCCDAITRITSEQQQKYKMGLFLAHGFVLTVVPGCFHNVIVIDCIAYTHVFYPPIFFLVLQLRVRVMCVNVETWLVALPRGCIDLN